MNIDWFQQFYAGVQTLHGNAAFEEWCQTLPALVSRSLKDSRHGKLSDWQSALMRLPELTKVSINFDQAAIQVQGQYLNSNIDAHTLSDVLMNFKPWRKGPFNIQGVEVDSEWRSDMKWDRLCAEISPLADRTVLDVGCGNGYHCWRMAAAGAKSVIGIDPMLLYVMQYFVLQNYIRANNVFVLPLTLEQLPENLCSFDTIFSMGVLYHRRSPIEHLNQLRSCLKPGGELILETLIIQGDEQQLLLPTDRYARMKNVWFIPSPGLLETCLVRCGFQDIRLIDISPTTKQEQRSTEWSGDASLIDFLDPEDLNKTVEGHPAPIRAVLRASL